jgi:hypothetical protein
MKANYLTFIFCFSIIIIFFPNCQKEELHVSKPAALPNANSEDKSSVVLLLCDDETAFQSPIDLEPLTYLQDCYSSTATKEVPGLGSISWVSNGSPRNTGGYINFIFDTYEPALDTLLIRESLLIAFVPPSIGTYEVYDNFMQQNIWGVYGRVQDDGETVDAYWSIDTTCLNFIEITQLDLECKEVRGNFEVHFILTTQSLSGILYSERINFLNGKFYNHLYTL